ncbi:Protein of unknown function (DUF594) [Quillaja saponaria]|uniref:DUF4220 domain-containing protein n=1 Tax=Quillaja saponaria TaxID=32244 RepID=A0AAD7KTJ0_QUISA|nr:Protein of unknown function (DUF594) [Quillaja saponaria]
MVSPIPHSVRKIWDAWNIRGVILASLSLQAFLILFAPFRKRTSRSFAIWSTWSAYLLADWAANFCVGLISNSDNDNPSGNNRDNGDLLAFWAPFLLVHLGGPDTITAFALEDNELWIRHLLGLVFQLVAAAYVFLQTVPGNSLWVPTLLVFFAGIIKYAERTRALYLASLGSFRESMLTEPDPGPNYAKLMEEYFSKKEARLPTRIEMTAEPDKNIMDPDAVERQEIPELDDLEVVARAHHYFNRFKRLIVDLILSFRERNESRDVFLHLKPTDALRVIEVELNFIYQVLYTKVQVVHTILGYLFRFLAFGSIAVALSLFFKQEKHGFKKFDVRVTYALLFGAIALDSVALIMVVFSDWTVASLMESKKNWLKVRTSMLSILKYFIRFKKSKWSKPKKGPYTNYDALETNFVFRRWSQYVWGHDLIKYCLEQCPRRKSQDKTKFFYMCYIFVKIKHVLEHGLDFFVKFIGARDLVDEWIYKFKKPLLKKLWELIFEELRRKAKDADDAETVKRICSARGAWVLQEGELDQTIIDRLMPYVDNEVAYDESIILWHIATDLCYYKDNSPNDHREFSKLLSDYMLYLLVMQPTMMSAVAGIGQIRFRDTCAETKIFFRRKGLGKGNHEKDACKRILDVNTDVKPVAVKGDRSKSVLFDACILAKELMNLNEKKWGIMSQIWVEILSHAASNCRAATHAQQVSKGGELISHVWLLMSHFGLGEQFQINEGHARAKLIVGK